MGGMALNNFDSAVARNTGVADPVTLRLGPQYTDKSGKNGMPPNTSPFAEGGSVYPNQYLLPGDLSMDHLTGRKDAHVYTPPAFVQTHTSLHTQLAERDAISLLESETRAHMTPSPPKDDTMKDAVAAAQGTPEADKIETPTPWCRKVLNVWLSHCPFGNPTTIKAKRKCTLILNTYLQKCVEGSPAADEHAEHVDEENGKEPEE